jgi:hypothetical protein
VGARGKVRQYADPIRVRFTKAQLNQIELFADIDGRSVNDEIRYLVVESLRRRVPAKDSAGKAIQQIQKALDDLIRLTKSSKPNQAKVRAERFIEDMEE